MRQIHAEPYMTFCFLHSSDLHLGKPFGRFSEDVRNRLRQARHDGIGQLAKAAREGGAGVVLLAGDTFDAETPAPQVVRHALNEMAGASDLTWVMMPGNHDSLAAGELWRVIAKDKPDNLRLALTPEPLELAPAVMLLPAPCTARKPGRDLTEDMNQATPEGAIRIGLGHGGIHDFASLSSGGSSEEGNAGIIPPDRAKLSGLDYLALGDWHGQMEVGSRTWYSGTPEKDAFKHADVAGALLVDIAASGAAPKVDVLKSGSLDWLTISLDILPDDDGASLLRSRLPDIAQRRDTLVRVIGDGRSGLQSLSELKDMISEVTPDFLHLETDLSSVRIAHDSDDLDLIDRAGALRSAAETLAARIDDETLATGQKLSASSALSLLFSYASEVS